MLLTRTDYLNKITPFLNKELIIVLMGLRRSGKSVILQQLSQAVIHGGANPECCRMYDLEFMLEAIDFKDGKDLLQHVLDDVKGLDGHLYLFFDEIQEVSGWELAISKLRRNLECDIVITGSNSSLLSGELATKLSGRYVSFEIMPFSYREFLAVRTGQTTTDTLVNDPKIFQEYLEFGSLPHLARLGYDRTLCTDYLRDIVQSVMFRDIMSRFRVREGNLLQRLLHYIMRVDGQSFSILSIRKYLKATSQSAASDTVANYLDYFEKAFLVHGVKSLILGAKEELKDSAKYYLTDHGFRGLLLGTNIQDINSTLENIVYNELLRRGYSVFVGKLGSIEVDFVAEKEGQRSYIQVSYLLASDEVKEREFKPLREINDAWPKMVLSLDTLDFSQDGIRHQNLAEWLLDD